MQVSKGNSNDVQAMVGLGKLNQQHPRPNVHQEDGHGSIRSAHTSLRAFHMPKYTI